MILYNAQLFFLLIILSSPYTSTYFKVHACIFSQSGNLPQVEFAEVAAHQSISTVIAARNSELSIAVIYHPIQIGRIVIFI